MTSEKAAAYLVADTLELVKLVDPLKPVKQECMRISQDLKQYHEKVFSDDPYSKRAEP